MCIIKKTIHSEHRNQHSSLTNALYDDRVTPKHSLNSSPLILGLWKISHPPAKHLLAFSPIIKRILRQDLYISSMWDEYTSQVSRRKDERKRKIHTPLEPYQEMV